MAIEAAGPIQTGANEEREITGPGRDAAERLVGAIAARDFNAIFATLAVSARLRFMIPRGPGEVVGAAETAAKYWEWFGDSDAIEVQEVLVGLVSDRTSARYRFLVWEAGGATVVEQQAYLDVDAEGRISRIDLLCSGFRPAGERPRPTAARTHEFDAGDLGCADGLAPEFRRRIGAIPAGHVLAVTVRDPAAKEDLPSLARLMGHAVRSIETRGDGRLTIEVERTR